MFSDCRYSLPSALNKVNFDTPVMMSIPESNTTYPILSETHVDPDPIGINFLGAFIADASINNAAAWIKATEYYTFLGFHWRNLGRFLVDS